MKKLNRRITNTILIQAWLFLFLIIADQLTKILAVQNLMGQDEVKVIGDLVVFRYLENTGAAFGIFQNKMWMFLIITAAVVAVLVFIFCSVNINLRKYVNTYYETDSFKQKTYSSMIFFEYIITTLCAGAIGNFIDRIRLGYVIDFIYFKVIDFPIFNFADICVTLSAAMLVIFFIFIYKDDANFSVFGSRSKKTDKPEDK